MRQGDAMSDKYRKGRITFLVNSGNITLKSAASLAAIAIFWDFVTELRAGFNMPFMLALGRHCIGRQHVLAAGTST